MVLVSWAVGPLSGLPYTRIVRSAALRVPWRALSVAYSSSAVRLFTICWAPRSTLSARSPSVCARSVSPAAWLPMMTWSRVRRWGALPGLNSMAASPTNPTATIWALRVHRGHDAVAAG